MRFTCRSWRESGAEVHAILHIDRTSVYRWCNGKIDPTGDTILEIVRVLKTMSPEAAEAFVNQYISSELDE